MCIVQEYILGERFVGGESLSLDSLEQAYKFFGMINSHDSNISTSIHHFASDGYLCLSDHINSIKNRLKSLQSDSTIFSLNPCLSTIIGSISDDFNKVSSNIEQAINTGVVADRLPDEYTCISPSDFGFHNAIKVNNKIKFIDFEFAGIDDPAKTLCDFIMQPRVPVLVNWSGLLNMLPQAHRNLIETRAKVMAPLHYLKWRCIILSCLSSDRFIELSQLLGTNQQDRLVSTQLTALRHFDARWQGIIQ